MAFIKPNLNADQQIAVRQRYDNVTIIYEGQLDKEHVIYREGDWLYAGVGTIWTNEDNQFENLCVGSWSYTMVPGQHVKILLPKPIEIITAVTFYYAQESIVYRQ